MIRQALISERQTITTRRASGTCDDATDSPRLALLNADIEGLGDLISRTRAGAPTGLEFTSSEASRLQGEWLQAQRDATATALKVYCMELEASLIEAASAISRLPGPMGPIRSRWKPSQRLRAATLSGIV